jgi:hypothetical protein
MYRTQRTSALPTRNITPDLFQRTSLEYWESNLIWLGSTWDCTEMLDYCTQICGPSKNKLLFSYFSVLDIREYSLNNFKNFKSAILFPIIVLFWVDMYWKISYWNIHFNNCLSLNSLHNNPILDCKIKYDTLKIDATKYLGHIKICSEV